MKFIKVEEVQKAWFEDEKKYELIVESAHSCLGKGIIFAQLHEGILKAIVVLDVAKVVVIKSLIVTEESLLSMVVHLVKQKYKNKDLVCKVEGLSLQEFGFVKGAYLRSEHLEDAFVDRDGLIERYPVKVSEKQVVLNYLAQFFEAGLLYTEREVNEVLKSHISFQDYVTLRRDLFDFDYLTRSLDGKTYEKKVR